MNAMMLLYVMVGGAVGSASRFVLGYTITRFNGSSFPYGTFTINILGSFLMGLWIATMVNIAPGRAKDLHLLLAVGVLGGFTTFSTFSLDMFLLFERGLWGQLAIYIIGSVGLSLVALFAGMVLVKSLSV